MTWVRIDDGFSEHPKVLGLSDAAFRLHVHALCYVARALTDGRIPRVWLTGGKSRKVPKAVTELVDARVWDESGEDFHVHDYLSYQPSRDEVEERRAAKSRARADAGRQGGIRSGEARREANEAKEVEANEANGKQNETKQRSKSAAPSHPIPIKREATPPRTPTLIRPRNLNAAFEHPRFDVPQVWHDQRTRALSDGEAGMLRFYTHLETHIDAHPDEDTEPRFDWLTGHFNAWVKARKQPTALADVDDVKATRERIAAMMSRKPESA